jgi:hypothetical protein
MARREQWARAAASLIAVAALAAMIPPLAKNFAGQGGFWAGVWALGRYFTILTNLAIGIGFAIIAWKGRDAVSPLVQGGLMLAIVLVGLVFNLLLPAVPQETLWQALGDKVHHVIMPLAVPLWWLAFARHGALDWLAPLVWAGYPLAYAAYIQIRAALEPPGTPARYPYFFMDVEKLGWSGAIIGMAVIALGFVVIGWLAVWIDRRLGQTISASSNGAGDNDR